MLKTEVAAVAAVNDEIVKLFDGAPVMNLIASDGHPPSVTS
jgi:hypothetical protein